MGKKSKTDLYLYACLCKDETGLPVNIRVDDSTAHKLYGHEKRLLRKTVNYCRKEGKNPLAISFLVTTKSG